VFCSLHGWAFSCEDAAGPCGVGASAGVLCRCGKILAAKIRRSGENSQEPPGELSQIIRETTSGNRVVKAFGMRIRDPKISRCRSALLRENMRWVRAATATAPIMDLLGAIVVPLLLLYRAIESSCTR